jgi:hypothetical protein
MALFGNAYKESQMNPTATIPSRTSRDSVETITIRMATSADAAALTRLAQLDSRRPAGAVQMLVAEAGGELRAALPLDGAPAIADPFQRTAELVAILGERARQLAPPPRRAARGWRPLRALRPAPAPRA